MKKCTKCLNDKPREEFYKARNKKNNNPEWDCRDSQCKPCRLGSASIRRKAIKALAIEYMGGECVDCGLVDDACVYDFHHLDPSKKDFSVGGNVLAFETMKPELDKCILLCSNCHRKRHYYLHV